ncbi:MAG: hypothetical protein EBS89_13870 [Proteobacteria bacterium]|nr:hypothetical protein [Pseudomonadota bacterium]
MQITALPPLARATRCWEVFEIQVNALITRMTHFGNRHLVLALSGGRDSTLAALACVGALDAMGLPRTNLTCVSMPGWGTTAATREASEALARALGATFAEEEISAECELVLEAQRHPAIVAWKAATAMAATSVDGAHVAFVTFLAAHPELADVELENVQARVRKLRVLTRANRGGALEVGTGDLSEKALGWSTFAGDQTALYDVNCGVPKTLVAAVIRWVADERVARENRYSRHQSPPNSCPQGRMVRSCSSPRRRSARSPSTTFTCTTWSVAVPPRRGRSRWPRWPLVIPLRRRPCGDGCGRFSCASSGRSGSATRRQTAQRCCRSA